MKKCIIENRYGRIGESFTHPMEVRRWPQLKGCAAGLSKDSLSISYRKRRADHFDHYWHNIFSGSGQRLSYAVANPAGTKH
jgi:hypothetical protein